ncbi:hypothetical protein [Methanoculleus sp. 10]|uniref:hypothetical protein n=1 Tax=Methanoculleus sp. 10 TaxID=430615 RepID=UPI0025E403A8|nr:hypothetical protein [Methanoculleus sp. 10]
MVLEEMLIIRGPIDTPEIARAFREAGMPARITQTVALEGRVAAKGTIGAVKALLREEVSRIEKLREEFIIEEGGEETDTEEDEDAGPGPLYDPFLDMVERIAGDITEFMERYQPGDVVPMKDLKEWMVPSAGVAPGEEPPDASGSALHRMMALSTMDENGLIKAEGEAVVVQGRMNLEDIVITLPGAAIEDIDPEVLNEHGVLVEMTVIPVPEYLLEFGPEAILEGDLDKLGEIADDLEIDEEEYESFRAGVSLKRVAIGRTLEILEERGTLTPVEVAEALGSSAVESAGEGWKIVLELTPEFVKGLLNDLKKVGLVRRKGEKFRAI